MIFPDPAERRKSPSKKELILKICSQHNFDVITSREIEMINAALEKELGPEGRTSSSYIANVLLEAGKEVRYQDLLVKSKPLGAYKEKLEGLLQFKDFSQAEQTLQKMDELHKEFKRCGDKEGLTLLRELAEKGQKRCLLIARNEKVDASKRAEKEEMAFWFKLWLDDPAVFFLWLELRKQSPEFREKFAKQ